MNVWTAGILRYVYAQYLGKFGLIGLIYLPFFEHLLCRLSSCVCYTLDLTIEYLPDIAAPRTRQNTDLAATLKIPSGFWNPMAVSECILLGRHWYARTQFLETF